MKNCTGLVKIEEKKRQKARADWRQKQKQNREDGNWWCLCSKYPAMPTKIECVLQLLAIYSATYLALKQRAISSQFQVLVTDAKENVADCNYSFSCLQ